MFCLRCVGTIPNVSKHAAQKTQPQSLKAVSGMPSRTTLLRQSSRRLLATTAFTRSIPSQLTRFSSPSSSLLRSTTTPLSLRSTSLLPSSSPMPVPITSPSPSSIRSFSATAYLGAKRDTYNPSRRVQKRRHGFLARLKTRGGRKVLMRRRAKGRSNLSW